MRFLFIAKNSDISAVVDSQNHSMLADRIKSRGRRTRRAPVRYGEVGDADEVDATSASDSQTSSTSLSGSQHTPKEAFDWLHRAVTVLWCVDGETRRRAGTVVELLTGAEQETLARVHYTDGDSSDEPISNLIAREEPNGTSV